MIKPLLLASLILFRAGAFAQEQGPVVMTIAFHTDEKSRPAAEELYSNLCREAEGKYRYTLKKNDAILPAQMPDALNDAGELKKSPRPGKIPEPAM